MDHLKLGSELFEFLAAGVRAQARIARALDPITHTSDEACALTLKHGTCTVCGVLHGDPCPACAAVAYHRPTCPELALVETTARVHPPTVRL